MERLLTTDDVAGILGDPEFTVTKRKTRAPMPHFVYVVVGPGEWVLYVGQTTNPASRIASHRRSAEWWDSMRRIDFYRFASRRDALDRELWLIRRCGPRYNVMANPYLLVVGE